MHAGKTADRARADALAVWVATPDDHGVTPLAAVAGQLGLSWRRAGMLGAALAEASADAGDPEAVAWLAAAEAAERDRVVRFAAVAHQMGLAEYWKRLTRMYGDELVVMIDGILRDLHLDAAQRDRVPEVVPRWLRALPDPGDDAA
jgi:hypothetical protein